MLEKLAKVPLALALIVLVGAGCASEEKRQLTKKEHASYMLDIANASLMEGDPTGALQALVQAEADDPSNPGVYEARALALFEKHQLEAAIAQARKAVTLKPDYSEANNTLGKLLTDAGKYDEAIPPLNKAANDLLYRENYKPLTNLGILYYRRGEYAKSQDYLDRAITASPEAACAAYYYRGHIGLRNNDFRDAIRDYDRATRRVCAAFPDAHLALGLAYERSHQYEAARKQFVEIQHRFPNSRIADEAIDHLRELP